MGVIICSPFGFNCSPCGWILDMNSGFYGSYLGVLLCVVGLSLIACGCVPQSVTGMEASTTKVWISANWRATSTMTTTTPCKSSGVFFLWNCVRISVQTCVRFEMFVLYSILLVCISCNFCLCCKGHGFAVVFQPQFFIRCNILKCDIAERWLMTDMK